MEKQKPDLSALKINRDSKESLSSGNKKVLYLVGIIILLLIVSIVLFNPYSAT